MDIVASQPIRRRDHDAIKGSATDLITQTVQSRTTERGPTVAIVSKHLLISLTSEGYPIESVTGMRACNGRRHHERCKCTIRLIQNLSFVIVPLRMSKRSSTSEPSRATRPGRAASMLMEPSKRVFLRR